MARRTPPSRSGLRRRDVLLAGAGLALTGNRAMAATRPRLHVPPEDDPHALTFMQWPASRRVHPDPYFLDQLQRTIAIIADAIAAFEPVVVLADRAEHARAGGMLTSSVELWDVPTEDLWCRDSGPLFAWDSDGELVVSHIQFNGWGGKQVHKRDGRVAAKVADRLGLKLVSSGLKGEAGGVEHDGHGLLMAHESSWVIRNRNPGLDRAAVERRLLDAYGADRMIWSPGVRGEDITDYHIDSLARFIGPGQALINLPDAPDRHDPFHQAAFETHATLIAAGLEVVRIPEPNYRRIKSIDFVASYANFYVCNGAVIVAEFGDDDTDAIAMETLRQRYPGREIVALNVDPLGEVGGGIHCATQQMPAAR